MSKVTNTPLRHFSLAKQAWEKCPAEIRCRLEHITENEYIAQAAAEAEEATLLNSKLGEAETAYIGAKTELSLEQIQETLRELRREGAQLPKPSAEEIEAFIEQERFKVENDPTLSKKEKREILKSLREAEKELDKNQQNITGGIFHAWKNGLLAALAKVRKPILVGALAGSLAFGLAACAPQNNTTAPPEKDPVETVQVADQCVDATVQGDVIPGELTSNTAGEYCSVVIDPDSPALAYLPSRVDPKLYEMGYTDAQLEEVQRQAVEKVIESQVDNPTASLDNSETVTWIQEKGDKILSPELKEGFLSASAQTNEYGLSGTDIAFGSSVILPPLVHDGNTRVSTVSVNVDSIQPRTLSGQEMGSGVTSTEDVEVVMSVTSTYRVVNDAEVYKTWRTNVFNRLTEETTPELITSVVQEEADSVDWSQPVFRDSTIDVNMGFTKEQVTSGEDNLLIRSLQTKLDAPGYWQIRN